MKIFSEKELKHLLFIDFNRELLKITLQLKKKEKKKGMNPKGRSGKQEKIVSKTIVNI